MYKNMNVHSKHIVIFPSPAPVLPSLILMQAVTMPQKSPITNIEHRNPARILKIIFFIIQPSTFFRKMGKT